MIPDEILNQILDRVDIAEVISGYIPLKRAGRNFKANCPFHHEKTPSFMVSPDKQIFHCFGCNEGGNVFGFIMKYERLDFPKAVEMLANKAGIQLPSYSRQDEEVSETAKIYLANEAAVNFYHHLLTKTDAGKPALGYLKKRGVSDEIIVRLKIGYAPDEWDAFLSYAKKRGFEIGLLEKAGLALSGKEGSYYDRFRNRVIFPIYSHKGRPLGFGGRVLNDTLPKYINSPQTAVYNKGSNLYGFNFAVEHIKQKDAVVITEGYMDFLMPYQAGIGNIAASLGTALTVEQIRLIKRFTKNIIMVFDPDSAGEAASLRGLDLALTEDMNVKVVTLPAGYDPDKFVSQSGADKFTEKINSASDFFEYKYRVIKLRYSGSDAMSKAKVAGEMLMTVAKVPNAVVKAEYIKRLSEHLDVDKQALLTEIKKIRPGSDFYSAPVSLAAGRKAGLEQASAAALAEKMLIGLALGEPRFIILLRNYFTSGILNKEGDFWALFEKIEAFLEKNKALHVAKLMNCITDAGHSDFILRACVMVQDIADKERCFKDCINNLKQAHIAGRMKSLEEKMKAAQAANDDEKMPALISEYDTLIKKKVEVCL